LARLMKESVSSIRGGWHGERCARRLRRWAGRDRRADLIVACADVCAAEGDGFGDDIRAAGCSQHRRGELGMHNRLVDRVRLGEDHGLKSISFVGVVKRACREHVLRILAPSGSEAQGGGFAMAEVVLRPTVSVGGYGSFKVDGAYHLASGMELGVSMGGVLFGDDRPKPLFSRDPGPSAGVTIMPKLSLGLAFPDHFDPNTDARPYAALGPRVAATGEYFGIGLTADAGVDLTTYGLRTPVSAGVAFFPDERFRIALKGTASFDAHLFAKDAPLGLSAGAAVEFTSLAF